MVAQHVHDAHGGQGRAKEVGALGQAGTHEEAAVGATMDGQLGGASVFLLDEPLGGGNEVIEDVLLLVVLAGVMPLATVLTAAPQAGLGEDAAHLQPGLGAGVEAG